MDVDWFTKSCFTPLLTVFQLYQDDRSHYSCLSWVSPVLGWGSCSSNVALQRKKKKEKPEEPVRLEPRTPGLQVDHSVTPDPL